ncbi:MAG: hypothetical protein HA495_00365 [Thaumarchaeota archaeon]|nr:hypothetical protein [Nitrososphaerota archaeon]
MVKCPKCGAEISELIAYITNVAEEDVFRVDKNGEVEYEKVDEVYGDIEISYMCPECGAQLFRREEDAKKFLLGEKVEVVEE